MSKKKLFINGMKDGIPIALGYLAVSFSFGIMAKKAGLSILQAVVLSATNVTSAGQFAGLTVITAGSSYMEMAFTQLIVNLRYCLMSCSLSQKFSSTTSIGHRMMVAYGNTDEIFGICSMYPGKLSPYYAFGAICVAVPGWTAIIASIWLLGGIQLFCMGVVGTYVGKIYNEVKQRPRFLIETHLKK